MQRTVHGTLIHYAEIAKTSNGQLEIHEMTYQSTEKDAVKAVKEFRKKHPIEAVTAIDEFTALYVLDDEIFFKYATIVDPTENPEK